MRRLLGLLAVSLLVGACPSPSGPEPVTGPGTGGSGATDTSGANTAEQMDEVQRSVNNEGGLRSALNRCFMEEMERRKDKKLAGNVMVKVLIGTNEHAEQVVIGENTLKGTEFTGCVVQTVKGWEFPKLNSANWFTYPFEFSPQY